AAPNGRSHRSQRREALSRNPRRSSPVNRCVSWPRCAFFPREPVMKNAPLVLALFATLLAAPAFACDDSSVNFSDLGCCSGKVHIRSRLDPRDARLAINTEDGKATMLITDNVIAVQLTDNTLNHIKRE